MKLPTLDLRPVAAFIVTGAVIAAITTRSGVALAQEQTSESAVDAVLIARVTVSGDATGLHLVHDITGDVISIIPDRGSIHVVSLPSGRYTLQNQGIDDADSDVVIEVCADSVTYIGDWNIEQHRELGIPVHDIHSEVNTSTIKRVLETNPELGALPLRVWQPSSADWSCS